MLNGWQPTWRSTSAVFGGSSLPPTTSSIAISRVGRSAKLNRSMYRSTTQYWSYRAVSSKRASSEAMCGSGQSATSNIASRSTWNVARSDIKSMSSLNQTSEDILDSLTEKCAGRPTFFKNAIRTCAEPLIGLPEALTGFGLRTKFVPPLSYQRASEVEVAGLQSSFSRLAQDRRCLNQGLSTNNGRPTSCGVNPRIVF